MRPTRKQKKKKKFHLNYSTIKLTFKSLIFHAPNLYLIIFYYAAHLCPVEFLISFQCTLHFANSGEAGLCESELPVSLQ